MKKWLCILLALLLPGCTLAEEIPVLVSIGLAEGTVQHNGRTVRAAGVGNRAPWGIHEADMIYENLLYQTGQTRLSCLFGRQFPMEVGPVRSVRASHLLQREEWNAILFYAGHAGMLAAQQPEMLALRTTDRILDHHRNRQARSCTVRVKGIKAPDNLSVDLTAVRALFAQAEPGNHSLPAWTESTVQQGESALSLTLDWGHETYLTRFRYDKSTGCYLRFSKNAPTLSYSTAERADGSGVQLAFENVIIQHVSYRWPNRMTPIPTLTGSGDADYLIGGQHIHGSWRRDDLQSPTLWLDADGNEIQFAQGKTYIAQFPMEGTMEIGK